MPLFGNLELLVARANNNARAHITAHSPLVTRRRASSRGNIIPAAVLPRSHIAPRKSDEGRSRTFSTLDRVAVTAGDLLRHCVARAARSLNADLAIIADLSGAKWLRRFIADVTSTTKNIDIRVR